MYGPKGPNLRELSETPRVETPCHQDPTSSTSMDLTQQSIGIVRKLLKSKNLLRKSYLEVDSEDTSADTSASSLPTSNEKRFDVCPSSEKSKNVVPFTPVLEDRYEHQNLNSEEELQETNPSSSLFPDEHKQSLELAEDIVRSEICSEIRTSIQVGDKKINHYVGQSVEIVELGNNDHNNNINELPGSTTPKYPNKPSFENNNQTLGNGISSYHNYEYPSIYHTVPYSNDPSSNSRSYCADIRPTYSPNLCPYHYPHQYQQNALYNNIAHPYDRIRYSTALPSISPGHYNPNQYMRGYILALPSHQHQLQQNYMTPSPSVINPNSYPNQYPLINGGYPQQQFANPYGRIENLVSPNSVQVQTCDVSRL